MSGTKMTMTRLMDRIPDEAAAYEYLEELRWNGKPECPHCGNDERCYFLNPENGASRKTRTGAASQRRVWKCSACRKQFSVLTNSVMHGTKLPIRVWVLVMFEMCANKNGVAAREIERRYGIAPRSAWFMTQRIREAMADNNLDGMFRGTIVADETFIGGKPYNNHRHGFKPKTFPEKKTRDISHLQPVLTLVNRTTGQVRSRVVADVRAHTLRKVIAEQVDMANSVLHTDAAHQYRSMGQEFIDHQWVDHGAYEYVRYTKLGHISTNPAEGYFSQLKRSIDGTHHQLSRKHLHRYLSEFDYRFSTRDLSDTERMARLMGRVGGRRLSYKPLTASTPDAA